MTTYKSFDKTNLRMLRSELDAVLRKFGADSNLVLSIGTIRFSANEARTKLEFKIKGSDAAVPMAERTEPTAGLLHILKMNGWGTTFLSPRLGTIQLIDYHPRKHKFPFIGRASNGKMFKFTRFQVQEGQVKQAAKR